MDQLIQRDAGDISTDKRLQRVATWLQQDFHAELSRDGTDPALNVQHALSHDEHEKLTCASVSVVSHTATASPMMNETFKARVCPG